MTDKALEKEDPVGCVVHGAFKENSNRDQSNLSADRFLKAFNCQGQENSCGYFINIWSGFPPAIRFEKKLTSACYYYYIITIFRWTWLFYTAFDGFKPIVVSGSRTSQANS